eukprot:03479.XXX_75720_76970_1 [CDS] Oithona nana genome sequencing.
MSVKKMHQFKNRVVMNENVAKAVLLLQSWPDECLTLFKMQQSPTKSIFTLPEIRDQFLSLIHSFPTADVVTLIQEIDRIEIAEAGNEFRYLTEVLDVASKIASKNADVQTFAMFEAILTDLKKRKQHFKLFEIAQNLLNGVQEKDKTEEFVMKHVIKLNKFIGDALSMQNEFNKALKYYKEACMLEEMLNNSGTFNPKDINAKTINHLGSQYFGQGNYDLALDYFSKSLELTPNENKDGLARVHNNIGLCLTEKQSYKEALRHFHDSLVIKQNEDFVNQDSIARTLGNMANCFQKIGDFSSALECHSASLKARLEFYQNEENNTDVANCYFNLGQCYNSLKQKKEAKENLQKALRISQKCPNGKNLAKKIVTVLNPQD